VSPPPRAAARSRGSLFLAAAGGAFVALVLASVIGVFFLSQRSDPPATAQGKANPPDELKKGPADKAADPPQTPRQKPETQATKPDDKVAALPDKTLEKLGPDALKADAPAPAVEKADAPPPAVEKPDATPQTGPAETEPKQPASKVTPVNPDAQEKPPPPPPVKPESSPPQEPKAGTTEPGAVQLVLPTRRRTLEEIKKALAAIEAPAKNKVDPAAAEREAALRRLKAYRYLAGVPYDNLVLDDELNRYTAAAARLCYQVGRIDHDPPNPGLPESEYELGRKGARNSNLCGTPRGRMSLPQSVDAYVEDSDPFNIGRLGHRRWCLSPSMRKVGFGRSGGCCAMWALDRSQPQAPTFDLIAYPAPGLMPLEFFRPHYAWSVCLNPAKYAPPPGPPDVSVYPADSKGEKSGPALPLSDVGVSREPMGGMPTCIVFRPKKDAVAAGKRYLVELKGIRRTDGHGKVSIRFPVEFVRLGNLPGSEKVVEPPQPDPDSVPAGQKAYASVKNLTDATIRLAVRGGGQTVSLEAGRTLNALAPLPGAGLTFSLLPPDPTGKPTPIRLRNGDHYVVRAEGKGYVVQKAPARPDEKGQEPTPKKGVPPGEVKSKRDGLPPLNKKVSGSRAFAQRGQRPYDRPGIVPAGDQQRPVVRGGQLAHHSRVAREAAQLLSSRDVRHVHVFSNDQAMARPFAVNASDSGPAFGHTNRPRSSPVAVSRKEIVSPPMSPTASVLPSDENATLDVPLLLWPGSRSRSSPLAASHSRTVPSRASETSVLPSAE
jgi:hypothetical protein